MAERQHKLESLRQTGTFNSRAALVRAPLAQSHPEFFDPRDKLQVKYEMLRAHFVQGLPVAHVCRTYGYSRQGFYQVSELFFAGGLAALVDSKPGRKGPTKCGPEVMAFVLSERRREPRLSGNELANRVQQKFGISVHRRTVERILAGRAKKNSPNPS